MSRSKHRLAASARPGRVLALMGQEMRQLPSTSTSQSALTLPSPSGTLSCNDARRDSQKGSTAKQGCPCPEALSTPTIHELSSDTAKLQALSQRAWRLLFHGAILQSGGPRLDRIPALGVPRTRPKLTSSPSPLLSPSCVPRPTQWGHHSLRSPVQGPGGHAQLFTLLHHISHPHGDSHIRHHLNACARLLSP